MLVLVRDQVAVVLCCAALAGQPHWFLVLLCCCAWMNITRKGVVRCIASHFCFVDNNAFYVERILKQNIYASIHIVSRFCILRMNCWTLDNSIWRKKCCWLERILPRVGVSLCSIGGGGYTASAVFRGGGSWQQAA